MSFCSNAPNAHGTLFFILKIITRLKLNTNNIHFCFLVFNIFNNYNISCVYYLYFILRFNMFFISLLWTILQKLIFK